MFILNSYYSTTKYNLCHLVSFLPFCTTTMTPTKNKKRKDKKKDNENRSSKLTRSKKTPLFEDIDQIIYTEKNKYSSSSGTLNKKRSATNSDNDIKITKKAKNKATEDDHSGTSYSCNNDMISSDESEASENKLDESEEEEIKEKVQSDDDSDTNSQLTKKKIAKKKVLNNSIFTPPVKSSIQWYCRNVIFQKLKIVDEVHLDSNGSIMKEMLTKFKIDEKSIHINAYLNEFRKIIRRVICSRRAYIKMMISETMKRTYLFYLYILPIKSFSVSYLTLNAEFIKKDVAFFDTFKLVDCFYNPDFETDKNVRNMWYLYCFNFLPHVNKDWKLSLKGSRVRKKTPIYKYITTSDEAVVLWFIKMLSPKLQDLCNRGWPKLPRATGKGEEQELKVHQKTYVQYYKSIQANRKQDNGEVAFRWNEIFWEEMVSNHPSWFETPTIPIQETLNTNNDLETKDPDGLLPDIDDDNEALLTLFSKRESENMVNASNQLLPLVINTGGPPSTGIGQQQIISTDIFNKHTEEDNTPVQNINGMEDILQNVTQITKL